MSIVIRLEDKADYREVENLTREAFWDLYKPGCDEHLLVHKLRNVSAFVPELDFVAVEDGKIVGSIVYSRAKVVDQEGTAHEVLTFGPISVAPSAQKRGIGSALIEHTKKLARDMGYKAIIIFGHPAYYHRLGFKSAEVFGISTAAGTNIDPFMALELYDGSLSGIAGRYHEDPVFEIDPVELEAFEGGFPFREKHVTDTQLK